MSTAAQSHHSRFITRAVTLAGALAVVGMSGAAIASPDTGNGGCSSSRAGADTASSYDDCEVSVPTVPVVDECGPGNAHYGEVPAGPWTSDVHPDGSLTITADHGYFFADGQTSVTYAVPTDSNEPCPVEPPPPVVTPPVVTPPVETPPVVTPPVVTPPVVTAPEVLPAQVKVVRATAKQIDKCGRASDLFKVAKRAGVVYKSNGKVLRQGVWIKAKTSKVTVRARTADATYALRGTQVWKLTFTRKPCAQAPEVSPNTGS